MELKSFNTQDVDVRYRGFTVKFHGPGQKSGSHFVIRDLRHNKRKVIAMSDELYGQSADQAAAYLVSIGITVDALMLSDFGMPHEVTLLSKDFATQLR